MANKRDIPFAGLYYREIKEQLVKYMRQNLPAGWDENENEPLTQIISAFAYGLHQTNALLDYVASNIFLGTVQDRAALANILRLIGVRLRDVRPSTAKLLVEIASLPSNTTVLIPAGTRFATKGDPQVIFSTVEDVETPGISAIYGVSEDKTTFNISLSVIANALKINVQSPANTGVKGVWEYYDASEVAGHPDTVTWDGAYLWFTLNSIFGDQEYSGIQVTIESIQTGNKVTKVVEYSDGKNRVSILGTMGQGETPSTDKDDYVVHVHWRPLVMEENEIHSDTGDWLETGEKTIQWQLPEGPNQEWGQDESGRYLLRYRCIDGSLVNMQATITEVGGKIYIPVQVKQGSSQVDSFTSQGEPNQTYVLSGWRVADQSMYIQVDTGEGSGPEDWTQVDDLFASTKNDPVYEVEVNEELEQVTIRFGDGEHGRIPPEGATITVSYWVVPPDVDGNVAPGTISVLIDGNSHLGQVWNPRAANGWYPPDGATQESLESLRVLGPSMAWNRGIVLHTNDVTAVLEEYRTSGGGNPIGRAIVRDTDVSPSTIEVAVLGSGGGFLSQEQKDDIQDWLNGNSIKGYPGRLILGMRAFVTDVNLVTVDVQVKVTVPSNSPVTTNMIQEYVKGLLDPLSKEGGVWRWGTDGKMDRLVASWLVYQIYKLNVDIQDVQVTKPTEAVWFRGKTLPTPGNITVEVVNA